ncbi:hypothetical protein GCM10010840_14020 [Deinococcus aerolatus]|uniref:Terminase small subunit n=1 Tax=Deinococcus aerolatus TaxID=522487 RepID=A0ABQ2G5V7_9DEIO|nr:hypothetical protein GCM10010840_14020 [Deinococcus aerolatus]
MATQDLKDRGWTPTLIARFLGEHDGTRPNGLRMGRRRLPPVKLYAEARVMEVERDDTFLAAQARAADARERAERNRAVREARRAALLEAAAGSYTPGILPEPLRKGAVRKARGPYLAGLDAALDRLRREIPKLTAREEARLAELLRERLDEALAAAYPWYPSPHPAPPEQVAESSPSKGKARASDWREWDWD